MFLNGNQNHGNTNCEKERVMRLILEIQRFNSKTDKEPAYQRYEVEVQPTERILDALMQIKSFQDPTLAFR